MRLLFKALPVGIPRDIRWILDGRRPAVAYGAGSKPATNNQWVSIGENDEIILLGHDERRAKEESKKTSAASLHIYSRKERRGKES